MFYNQVNPNLNKTKGDKDNELRNDFKGLREGDFDPVLGKKIEVLIENGGNFIVYLDPEQNIQYAAGQSYKSFSEHYGRVLNKVSELEGLSDRSFMTKKQVREYRCMIGAAISRMYEHDSREVIFDMLDKAEYFLRSRVTETASIWYLSSASLLMVLLITIWIIIYFLPSEYYSFYLHLFFSGTVSGAAGAYLSLIMNSKKINVNPSSGRTIHFFESITRVLIGMIGGFFSVMMFHSGIINIGVDKMNVMQIMIFSFAAGFSERMVPNLIHHFEGKACNGKQNGMNSKP